jgi:ABC-type uncharacterized transport system substrate-binding protein
VRRLAQTISLLGERNSSDVNVTGVNFFLVETRTKLLGLLHDLVPTATTIGLVLGIGSNTQNVDVTDLQTAARSLRLRVRPLRVATERDVDDSLWLSLCSWSMP